MVVELVRVQDPALAERMLYAGTRAFANDHLHLATFPPRLHNPDDPDEAYRFKLKALRKRLADPGAWSIVAMDEDIKDADGNVRVLGYAGWYQPGANTVAFTMAQEDKKDDGGWVDDGEGGRRGDGDRYPKCMDIKVKQITEELLEESKREILGDPAEPAWYLGSMAVDPDFAGRGIASRLAQWGIDKARQDGVSAFLEATPAALGLYKRLGFQVVREFDVLGDGHMITSVVMRHS